MPKPPKRIVVGPFTYRVTHDRATMNARCRTEGGDLMGSAEHRSLTIDLDPDQAPGQKRDTVLHEVLHTITEMTGLALVWGNDDEDFIRRISPVLLDVLRRNPKLVGFLTADD